MTIASPSVFALKLTVALGSALIAGVFFAFSTFVMKALAQQPPAQGIAAMQSINITVINPWFMVAFLGTALGSILLIFLALFKWNQPAAIFLLVGGLLYFVGSFLVTMVFNVPLNDALAIAKPDSTEAAALWADYLTRWTFWNHVRTIASFAAAALLSIASIK
jgi:uncharacterized membrane protein